jgi:hypothetical protein
MDQITVWTASRYCSPDTLRSYQRKSRRVLQKLRELHPKFERLMVVGTTGTAALPADLSGLEELIEVHAFSSAHAEDYLALGCDGRLASESLSRIGFSLAYCSTGEGSNSITPPERGGVDLTLQGSCAAIESSASANLKLPADADSDMRTPPTIKATLLLLVKEWESAVGGVMLRQYQQAVRGTDRASYAGQWLFYLPFPNLANCLPPDIRHERFANGILIETTPHIPDANNPSDVAAGKRVRDVLDELGLVNDATYAIEGWPPDNEETLYEQFISGAPPGCKYTVHCVNFDGYDPDRKVLLYAKLFRRLRRHPKQWGLRGWDGPVLNEAKRQVRAAAKAGGVPIEWHIGLEEPAHAVRQLLADHTNITDQQLRVIYTPLEQAHDWRQT